MNGLSETRSNACLSVRCKARLLHSYFVRADSKLFCSKETLLVRCYSTRLIGQRALQCNFRVGNDSTAGVAHNAFESCSDSRCLSGSAGRAKQQRQRYSDPDSNITDEKQTASHNHLESRTPIHLGTTKKCVSVEERGRPITAP